MAADHSQVEKFQKRLAEVSKSIDELSPRYGMAKTVIAYDGDRRKSLLAEFVVQALKEDVSHAEAETRARANPEYKVKLEEQSQQLDVAYRTVSRWDALKCAWDTGRSLLAMERETVRNLPETEA